MKINKPVFLSEEQKSALLVGTIHNAFSKAIKTAQSANIAGKTAVLKIVHLQVGNTTEKTLFSSFEVMK